MVRLGALGLVGALLAGGPAPAADIGVTPTKLIVVDKLVAASKAKAVFVAKDGGVTKGGGTDAEQIAVQFDVVYGDGSVGGAFVIPAGTGSGWLVNKDSVAKYVNKDAPAGPTGAKVAVIKPTKLLKLVGKSLGDAPLDILGAGDPGAGGVKTAYCVTNGAEENCHCSHFTGCAYKSIAGGTGAKLVCKAGTGDATCGAVVPLTTTTTSTSTTLPPPVLTTQSAPSYPTAGGVVLTLTGANLGTSGADVTVGGAACAPVTLQTPTTIECVLPAGQGLGNPVFVTVGAQASNALLLDYDPPLLAAQSAPSYPTAGGVPLTLTGTNFGTSGAVVTVEGEPCVPVTLQTHTEIECELPPGIGVGHLVQVTVGGQASGTVLLAYDSPVLFGYSAPSYPPNPDPGDEVTLTLTGTNFGTSGAVVTVGGALCPVLDPPGTHTHTQVECELPPGSGAGNIVEVTVGGQTSNALLLAYDPEPTTTSTSSTSTSTTSTTLPPPVLTTQSAPSYPTAGGVTLTLTGTNLGTSGAVVTVGGAPCDPVTLQTHTQIECELPAGSGTGNVVEVTVGGQTSNTLLLDYDPPVLAAQSAPSYPTDGGVPVPVVLTLTGTNFGTSGAVVTVEGEPCVPVTLQTHTEIECELPEGQGTTNQVEVVVGGQASNPVLLAYDPPVLFAYSAPSYPTDPQGEVTLTLTGTNLGTSGAVVTVGGAPCDPVTLQTHTQIECELPPGSGAGNIVEVTVGGQTSNALLLAYDPEPTTTSTTSTSTTSTTTLPPPPFLASLDPVPFPTAGGVTLTLFGTNLGTSGADVTVGGAACVPVTVQTPTTIECDLPEGQGVGNPVVVTVGGQISNALSLDYDAPQLFGHSAPSYPTAGGVTLTLTGTSLGTSGAVVTVGGAPCDPVTLQTHTQIECELPAGSGTGQIVEVTVGGQTSNGLFLNYDPEEP